MSSICRRCSRVNPPHALFCYFDGVALDTVPSAAPLPVGVRPFVQSFSFPGVGNCRNFDELVLACDNNWDAAKEALRLGRLTNFFQSLHRPDLVHNAKQAAKQRDADRGLDQLLLQLPCTARQPARLNVQPLLINLGQLIETSTLRLPLHLKNEGGGLLYGSITAEADWLTLGEERGTPSKLFQFHHDFDVTVQVVAKNLRASSKPLEGRLVVESNGGLALALVRVEVPHRPFPSGVLAGALTPRDLARKAKAAPKEAAQLFDSGAVRQWYESNGWTYPIHAPAAKGLAGLQQFFETLGLAKPPRLTMSASRIQLFGRPGETLQYLIRLQAVERKYVFAQARSTVGWLQVASATAGGQRAQILLRVPQVPPLPGQQLHGFIHVTANGGQRFTVEVHLTVQGERHTSGDSEVIPMVGLADVLPEPVPEVISLVPLSLHELLDAQPLEEES